jgi:PKD repeat protein
MRHSLQLLLFTIVALSISFVTNINAYAQLKQSEYKGTAVVSNSIVVKIDDSKFKAKGLQTLNESRIENIKSSFEIGTNKVLHTNGIEEWKVKMDDYEEVLEDLNNIPGVNAFPNYIFKRGDYKPVQIENVEHTNGTELDSFLGNLNSLSNQVTPSQLAVEEVDGYGLPLAYLEDFSNPNANEWDVKFHSVSFSMDNIVHNGAFMGSDFWFDNSLEADFGSVHFDDTLKFEVNKAGNQWDLQAYQILTPEQIDKLSNGGEWELTFDAMSPDGAKTFHVFLGHNGGDWARYWAPGGDGDITVDDTMKTYTLTADITQTWENMKLGFEVGASDADLLIDNVALRPVPKNIVQNGDFSNGDSLWTTEGNRGTVTYNDSLVFTVESAGNPWELQAFQVLSAEQIAALSEGGEWKLTFDAMSPDGAKSFHVFLGENGGSWSRYWDGNVDVDGEMKTYTLTTNITQTWDNMKLGFEVSGDAADLVIDNVSLMRSVPENSYENIFYDDFTEGGGWHIESEKLKFTLATAKPIQFNGQITSPAIDLSGLDSLKKYRFVIDYQNEMKSDLINLVIFDVNSDKYTSIDLTPYSQFYHYWGFEKFEGDTVRYAIYTQGGSMPTSDIEELFSINHVRIEEYPVNDFLIPLQYSLYNDGTFGSVVGSATVDADIDAFEAWEYETGEDSVVVIIMDDGVDFDHPDLVNQAWVNPGEDLNGDGIIQADEVNGIDDDGNGFPDDFHGWSSIYNDNSYMNPGSFHGTHVAGTVGAEGGNGIGVSGVTQDVKMVSVMIFDEFGSTTALGIMLGYEYMTAIMDDGVDVVAINQSWGGGENMISEDGQGFVMEMTNHAQDHYEHGAVWVVSAGNSSLNRDEQYFYSIPNNINSPNVITVASSDWNDNPSGFTDFGVYTVDIYAPGDNIASTYPDDRYVYMSGTSMASPHVTGAMALAKSMYPDESGVDIMIRMLASGDVKNQLFNVGEAERLNAVQSIFNDGSGIIPSHYANATFQRVFFEEAAEQSIGFINKTSDQVSVSSVELPGSGAWSTDSGIQGNVIESGGSFSMDIKFDNRNVDMFGEAAPIYINLSNGTQITIPAYGRELVFPDIKLSNYNTYAGEVPKGDVVEGQFDIINESPVPLYYDVQQSLQRLQPEESAAIKELNQFDPVITAIKEKPIIGAKTHEKYQEFNLSDYQGGSISIEADHGSPGDGPLMVWFDNLDNAEAVYQNWMVRDLSGVGEIFELIEFPEAGQYAFMAGDFATGYLNDAFTDAITPSFDFSNLIDANGEEFMPAYLEFDYAASLENGYDLFTIPVFVDGFFEGYVDMTDYGTLVADGQLRRAIIDISMFAGLSDVRFGFTLEADSEIVEGWGVLFDNVGISVVPKPYFVSNGTGVVEPGESQTVSVSVETAKVQGGGAFRLNSMVQNNSLMSFYYGAPIFELDYMIKTNPPVAQDDTLMIVSGDMISMEDVIIMALANDYSESGELYVSDVSDPVHGQYKMLDFSGIPYYVAPLNYDGHDMIRYIIEDGQTEAEGKIHIMVMAEPGFKTGANQQFVLLEDNNLHLSTMTMAAGVGGMDKDMMVWGQSMHDAVQVTHTPGEHVIMITAAEDYYGQSEAMLYAGHENHVMDSMMVSVVITPVNDAPVASFNIEQNQAGGSEFNFANTSNDARDPEGAIVQYEWNFGDGTTSNEKDPYHNYSAVGDYSVTLKVTDNSGSEAEYSENVSITVLTSSEDLNNPNVYSLAQNYPNPFNPSTLIQYSIAEPGNVTLEVYNMLGQKVAQLVNGTQNAGAHTIQFDASALSSGVYIYQLKSGSYLETRKMMLIK